MIYSDKYRLLFTLSFTLILVLCLMTCLTYAFDQIGDSGYPTTTGSTGEAVNPPPPLSWSNPDAKGRDAADPVDMVEGNYHNTVTDMFIPVSGLPLAVNRTYHNRTQYGKGYFGFGWTSLLDMAITGTSENAVLRQSDGTILEFKKMDSAGIYQSPKGWNLSLKKDTAEDTSDTMYETVNYTLKEPDGTEYKFCYYLPKALRITGESFIYSSGADGITVTSDAYNAIESGRNWKDAEAHPQGLQSVSDRFGNKLTINYTCYYVDTSHIESQVKKAVITHSPSGKKITLSRKNIFDSAREMSISDETGQVYRYQFDAKGNLENVINPSGGTVNYTYNPMNHNLLTIKNEKGTVYIDNVYDPVYDRVATQVYNRGNYKFNYGDSNSNGIINQRGNNTVYYYDTSGNITRVEEPSGVVTVQTYDTSNNKLKSIEQGDHKTTYGYDSSGNVTQVDEYVATNVSYRTRYEYETAYNQPTLAVKSKYNWADSTENILDTTVFEYGEMGTLTRAIRGYGTALADTTSYEYYENGTTWRYGLPAKISNAVNTIEYEYDSNGWATAIKTNALVNGIYKKRIIRRAYNGRGNVRNEKVCMANTDGIGEETKSESILNYDASDRLKDVTDSTTGKLTGFDYDSSSNLTTITNAEGLTTENIYNEYDQLKAVIRRSNGVVYDSVGYSYDSSENLKTITDALGRTTTYDYDELDRVSKITDPLNNVTQFGYDQWSNLTSRTTPNGKTITYEYDRLNRMTNKTYSGTSPLEEFNYTYKDDTRLLLTASGPSGTINYDYDGLYRLKQVIDPYYNTTTYEYDEGNRRKKMTVSKTYETCEYVYDSSNQLISIDNHGTFNFEYDAFGQMSKKTMANGTYTEFTSDHLGRLKSLMNYKSPGAATAPGSVISQYLSDSAGDFDLLGNRKKVSTYDEGSEYNYEYNYDSVYQLKGSRIQGVEGFSEEYSYDLVGNRLKGQGSGVQGQGDYLYDSANRLETLTHDTMTLSYTYDNNGSRITKTDTTGVTNYTYDYENRLKRIDFANGDYAKYEYDALGRRIKKEVFTFHDSRFTIYGYSYDGEDIIAVLDSTNNAIASITHGPGIDHPLSYKNIATGQVYYYNQDYLGSITSITDDAQNVVASATYDAFGNILIGDLVTWCSGNLVYSYTGREYDQESGLYFYRARYYDSKVGRFLEPDPIGFLGGVNFYAYVGNKPIDFIDPLGLKYAEVWGGTFALAGGGIVAAVSTVVNMGTGGLNILATPAEIGAGMAAGGALGYGLGSVLDWVLDNNIFAKGERNWEKGRGDDPYWNLSRDELRDIEKSTQSTPREKERAKRIRKQKDKKCQ